MRPDRNAVSLIFWHVFEAVGEVHTIAFLSSIVHSVDYHAHCAQSCFSNRI